MNFRNFLSLIILTLVMNFSALARNIVVPSNSINSLKSTTTDQGGIATGGGNTYEMTRPNPSEIKEWINQAKEPARFALKRIEYFASIGKDFSTLVSLNQKIFKGKVTLYEALLSAELQPVETGDCHDKNGNAVDGSAIDAPKICLSLQRLSKRLDRDTGQQEIVALILHEVSHVLGTNEDEAQTLQFMVKSSLSKDPITNIPLLVSGFKSSLQAAYRSLESLNNSLPSLQDTEICFALGGLQLAMSTILGNNFELLSQERGFSYFRLQEFSILYGASLKSVNTMPYCQSSEKSFPSLTQAFAGKIEMNMPELQLKLYPGAKMIPPPDKKIRRILPADKSNLISEIADIQILLKELLNSF